MSYKIYLINVSISIVLFYLCYLFIIRKANNFKQIRLFIITSMILSFIIPFIPFRIYFLSINDTFLTNNILIDSTQNHSLNPVSISSSNETNIQQVVLATYFSVVLVLLCRFLISLIKVTIYLIKSEKLRKGKFTYVYLDRKTIAFSFFHWIFISKSDKYKHITQIIEHEKVHARQYHSIDIILSEIMAATMWFNPFVWMFRRAIKQIHEYLADEGVIESGFNLVEYKSLLINQAAEGRLVAISSHFSYSLIKKRLVMMSEKKKESKSGLKMLIVLPVAALIFMGVSIQKSPSTGNNEKTGSSMVSNETVNNDPNVIVVSREELVGQGQLMLSPDETEFSQAFRVMSFTVATSTGDYEESYDQKNGPTFTDKQIDLIKRAKSGKKVYIENIRALGPEGELRDLGTIVFKIR